MAGQHQIATIMAVDVAGYSRAAEVDDDATTEAVARLGDRIQSVVVPLGGRIFNTAGDGFMIEFALASSGVQAALQLLAADQGGDAFLPPVRIGLHLGEVVAGANGDLLGHGVNVAARLQALAEPGTAVVSQMVRAQVRAGAGIPFRALGKVQLDKMNERLEVFALAPRRVGFTRIGWRRLRPIVAAFVLIFALAAAGVAGWRFFGSDAVAAAPRIAVLRFESLGDTEPYFAEGLADELSSELSRIEGMEVVARASSFALAGDRATPSSAARELGATLLLTGSVRRAPEAIRVQAQLVEAPSGRQIWNATFEQPPSQVFALQREIAVRVALATDLRVTAPPPREVDPEAFRLYLSARELWQSSDTFAEERDLLRAAVERDPRFAQAWERLAVTEYLAASALNTAITPATFAPALQAADTAIAIDPSLPEPYWTRADVFSSLRQWNAAAAAFHLAPQQRRGTSTFFLNQVGRIGESRTAQQQGIALNPLFGDYATQSEICDLLDDAQCQLDAARRAFEISPQNPRVAYILHRALIANDRLDEARALRNANARLFSAVHRSVDARYLAWLTHDSPPPPVQDILALVERSDGDAEAALTMLGDMGEFEAAASMLPRWEPQRLQGIYEASYAPLRRTPAFWTFTERVGLLGYWRESGQWPDFCRVEPVCPN